MTPPNVVLLVLDDLGFAQLGCFGSDIATPHVDRLAAEGLRYHRFHVTALCSPTRASLLTGRNHHAVGMGFLAELGMTRPGYSARLPASAATLPRILRDAGYATLGVGKWHLTPGGDQSAAGPFDRWPLGLGFERYYGFHHGETNHFSPQLVRDNHLVDPPRTADDGYHLTEDLADTAISYVYDVLHAAPGKPFFLYVATGATHAPHHVPAEWVRRYAGAYDDGWDVWRERTFARQLALGVVPPGTVLTERPSWVTPWSELAPAERARYARSHEVYAAFLTHTDAQIGRLLAALDAAEVLDDTLVVLLSDNGASAEGGPHGMANHRAGLRLGDPDPGRLDDWGSPRGYPHYPWGWAWAGNTPFRLWKKYAWLGGTRTPLVLRWPRGIAAAGAVRSQFCHAVDIAPTILECCGVEPPAVVDGVTQQPVDGASLAATFDDAAAPSPRRVQYFEVLGSRSIVDGEWKATTDHVGRHNPWEEALVEGSRSFEEDRWSLYRMDRDFSEYRDAAADHPDVVQRLRDLWFVEAGRNQVLPLDDAGHARDPAAIVPSRYPPRDRSVYRPGGGPISAEALPPLAAGGRISADVGLTARAVEGVLCALGDANTGFAFYVVGGEVVFAVSAQGRRFAVAGPLGGASGAGLTLSCTMTAAAGATRFELSAGERLVASGTADLVMTGLWGTALTIGHARGLPLRDDYTPPFAWTGTLHAVTIEVPPAARRDLPADVDAALRSE